MKLSEHYYRCDIGVSYCSKSVDPSDPIKSVGDRIYTNFPDRGVSIGTIISIESTEDPSDGNGSSFLHTEVLSEAIGKIDQIVTNQNQN